MGVQIEIEKLEDNIYFEGIPNDSYFKVVWDSGQQTEICTKVDYNHFFNLNKNFMWEPEKLEELHPNYSLYLIPPGTRIHITVTD